MAQWLGGAVTCTLGSVAATQGVMTGVPDNLGSWLVSGGVLGATLRDGWESVGVCKVLVRKMSANLLMARS
jgi:hypothetical protein